MAVPVAPVAAKQKKGASGRKWLDNGDKKKVLDDLKARSVIVVADKWGVSVKTIRRIIKDKSLILAAPVGAKRVRVRDGKPTFEKRMIDWMELVRKTKASAGVKLNINRVALTVGAQLVRSSLLEPDSGISAAERAVLEQWEIGHNWAKDFVSRHKLKSVVLHGTGGDVEFSPALLAAIEVIKKECDQVTVDTLYVLCGKRIGCRLLVSVTDSFTHTHLLTHWWLARSLVTTTTDTM